MINENSQSSSPHYNVEKILKKRVKNGKAEYKVKWQGFSIRESTWEPINNLSSILNMVDDFDDEMSQKDRDYRVDGNDSERYSRRVRDQVIGRSSSTEENKITRQKIHVRDQDSSDSLQQKQSQKLSIRIRQEGQNKRQQHQQIASKDDNSQYSGRSIQYDAIESSDGRYQNVSSSSVEVVEKKSRQTRQDYRLSLSQTRNNRNYDKSRSDSKNQHQNQRPGSYKQGDRVNEVISIRKNNQTQNVEFNVSWKKRDNGKNPSPSWVSESLMIERATEMLCRFLLSKIKWPK